MKPAEMVREFHEAFDLIARDNPQTDGVEFGEKLLRELLTLEEGAELVCAFWGYRDAGALAESFREAIREHAAERYPGGVTVREDGHPSEFIGVADALADLVYVLYGTALHYGIDLDAAVHEVHRSNMSKLGEGGEPIRRKDGKVLKGPNFTPPDLEAALLSTEPDAKGHHPDRGHESSTDNQAEHPRAMLAPGQSSRGTERKGRHP